MPNLPRYTYQRYTPKGVRTFRFNPPRQLIDSGVVSRKELGKDLEEAKRIAKELNKIIDECKNAGVIITHDARKIDQLTKMKVQQKHSKDVFERFPTENLISLAGMELDHLISVKKGGDGGEDNLHYTAKKHNRQKGAA